MALRSASSIPAFNTTRVLIVFGSLFVASWSICAIQRWVNLLGSSEKSWGSSWILEMSRYCSSGGMLGIHALESGALSGAFGGENLGVSEKSVGS